MSAHQSAARPRRLCGESRRSGRAKRGRGRCRELPGDPTAPHPPRLTPLPFPPSAPAAARRGCRVRRPPPRLLLHVALCVLLLKNSSAGALGISPPASLPSPGAYPASSHTSSAPFDTSHFLLGPLSVALALQHTPFFTRFTLHAFTLYFLGSYIYFTVLRFQSSTCSAIKQPRCHPARPRCGALRPSQPGGLADGSCERYTSASPAGKPRLCRML